MRCGDTVLHVPSGEEWLVAYVNGDYLAWCGWPPGEALVSDCRLVEACSAEEHLKLLRQLAAMSGEDSRKRHAINALAIIERVLEP